MLAYLIFPINRKVQNLISLL